MDFFSYQYLLDHASTLNVVYIVLLIISSIVLVILVVLWILKRLYPKYREYLLIFTILTVLLVSVQITNMLSLFTLEGDHRTNIRYIEEIAKKLSVPADTIFSSTVNYSAETIYMIDGEYYRLVLNNDGKNFLIEYISMKYIDPITVITK
ncbi:DUF3290 family protein [Breznakiella homolactica]|uniref:DUF3290 family protein n=1 Tax=Breznakiella homolactica TaxID=2798577 RepID=A0A7T7XLB0_9SPIR|nr:DUF3290 family protein [Breznakiella homolactica]QQO08348.1 DUF3290 domain-containing protein [Breznakiella homolactica]